mgnify:CR=1 FL=1
MSLSTERAGYRLRDNYDQDILGYMTGFKQSVKNGVADTVRTAPAGTKADTTAGADELLLANKLDITDFGGSDIGGAPDSHCSIGGSSTSGRIYRV